MRILPMLVLILALPLNALAQRLSEDIPFPFYEVDRNSENEIMIVNDGMASFQLRLEMIRRAKERIEVEYFIYNTDLAGKVFTRELIAAAARGVKVRILIDKTLPVFQFNRFYAMALASHGIEVRYYNNAPLVRISTVQFRNHRKLLSIDDREAITGGRNIGDDYFDLSTHFNFYDRDIYVSGPLVRTMRLSFDEFFEDDMSERPRFTEKMRRNSRRNSEVEAFLSETPESLELLLRLESLGKRRLALERSYTCPEATFSSDAPGAKFSERIRRGFGDRFRFLRKTLDDKVRPVDKALTISSPYMIHNRITGRLMHELLRKNVDITIYTNSLGSTDAVYVAANLYLEIRKWRRLGIKIFLHDGKDLEENPELAPEVRAARWGTHDKAMVYETSDYSEVMVGTYNIDNRSNFYNAEMAVFCKGNDELSRDLKESILERARKGFEVLPGGRAVDRDGNRRSIYAASPDKIAIMKLLTLPSWLLSFLL
jgi:putative cardiolipin synthase